MRRNPVLRRAVRRFLLAFIALGSASAAQSEPAPSKLPPGFVYLRDVAPGILEDMRYATPRNFTGLTVRGYRAGRCILARPAAEALVRVDQAVARYGYALKVYDCYRPVRAVRAFVRWANAGQESQVTKYYYPRIPRTEIIARGYVSEHSSHSRGTAVDLTLVRHPGAAAKPTAEAAQQPTAPKQSASSAASCLDGSQPSAQNPRSDLPASIDMGTAWDCFDVKSHTEASAISPAARRNRALLVSAMRAQGFRNYHREWWHFSWPDRRFREAHDFPVE